MDKVYHQIYVGVHAIYDNTVIPIIPKLIIPYLLSNPTKITSYINSEIDIKKILETISFKNSIKSKEILEEIIKFIEGS